MGEERKRRRKKDEGGEKKREIMTVSGTVSERDDEKRLITRSGAVSDEVYGRARSGTVSDDSWVPNIKKGTPEGARIVIFSYFV